MNISSLINTTRPLTINFDFNNVIQDNIGAIIRSSCGFLTREDFYCWDPPIGYKVGLTEAQFINWAWKNDSLQMTALPFDGVKNAIDRLRADGHKIQIVTSTRLPEPQLVKWLERWQIEVDAIIFSQNKLEVGGDILIDDSPDTIQSFLEARRPIIKFDLPWNMGIDCSSFSDWRLICQQ